MMNQAVNHKTSISYKLESQQRCVCPVIRKTEKLERYIQKDFTQVKFRKKRPTQGKETTLAHNEIGFALIGIFHLEPFPGFTFAIPFRKVCGLKFDRYSRRPFVVRNKAELRGKSYQVSNCLELTWYLVPAVCFEIPVCRGNPVMK